MKTYMLWLHSKQGDDFAEHVEHTKTPVEAFESWANSLAEAQRTCLKVAETIHDQKVTVFGDVNFVMITAKDKAARIVLDKLVTEKILTVFDE
jgi:hypothetical protein